MHAGTKETCFRTDLRNTSVRCQLATGFPRSRGMLEGLSRGVWWTGLVEGSGGWALVEGSVRGVEWRGLVEGSSEEFWWLCFSGGVWWRGLVGGLSGGV